MSGGKNLLLAAACVVIAGAQSTNVRDSQTAPAAKTQFDVASVKPSKGPQILTFPLDIGNAYAPGGRLSASTALAAGAQLLGFLSRPQVSNPGLFGRGDLVSTVPSGLLRRITLIECWSISATTRVGLTSGWPKPSERAVRRLSDSRWCSLRRRRPLAIHGCATDPRWVWTKNDSLP
jgi:hypothetical protein